MSTIMNGDGNYACVLLRKCYMFLMFCEVLHVPYVKGFSEGLQRKLRKLKIGVVPKKGETLYSHLCKQKKEKDESKDAVYSIRCDTCRV